MTAQIETEALEHVLRGSLARRSLVDFAELCFPGWKSPAHVRLMAEYLERLERGEIRRLLVMASVRHGKSLLCSQVFPAFFLGRNPRQEVVLASYASDLAERNSRVAKSLVESDSWPFVGVKVAADSKAISRWNVEQGGGCRAIGVGSGITGRGASLLVIDDPHAISSDVDRAAVCTWYRETITPRLNAGARVALISARFSDADLAGTILNSDERDDWTVLRLPALCDSVVDPLGRDIGEALWPEHMSREEIESRRIAMGETAFSAQFQQNPVPASGSVFQASWLSHSYETLPSARFDSPPSPDVTQRLLDQALGKTMPPRPAAPLRIVSVDSAFRSGVTNDRSVFSLLVSDAANIHIADMFIGRLTYPDLKTALVAFCEKHRPVSRIYIEDAASGLALVDDLRRTTALPIVPVISKESKITRAESVTGFFESGRIKWPKNAPWLEEAIGEFLRFPVGRFDDCVDSVCQGVIQVHNLLRAGKMYKSNAELAKRLQGFMAR